MTATLLTRPIVDDATRRSSRTRSVAPPPQVRADRSWSSRRDQAQLDAAKEQLRAATAGEPDLQLLATSPTEELVYVLGSGGNSELLEYAALGLVFLDAPPLVFEEVSWERISGRSADVILVDARSFVDTGFLASHPIWPTLPAVQAGQVGEWFVGTMYRMPFFTRQLRELAELIARSRDVA